MVKLHVLARRSLLLAALAATTLAGAQTASFPGKPIKWIVGYPAGGGSDFIARTIGAQMSAQMGQPVVVDNRPGAGAIIGADLAAKSPGDGYTIFTADNGVLVYNPVLYKKLPYDAAKDFAPIGLIARAPLIVVAAPNADIKNARELLSKLKSNPGKYSYGSAGNGSPHHLAMELLKNRLGLFVVHVPYRGTGPAMQDLMGGQIPLMVVDASSGLSNIKAGKIIPLVTLSPKRVAQLPDVPTMAELGYKDVVAYAWQGLVVPSSTPKDIQTRLSTELQAAISNPAVKKKLYDTAWDAVPSDGAFMSAFTFAETKIWQPVIRERGIALD
jgi:tripartite-type tricarboxylate transporter receptor subunit TctC